MAGAEITLPAPLIRSKSLDLRGFYVALSAGRASSATPTCGLTEHAAGGDIVVDVEARRARRRRRRRGSASAQAAGGPKQVLVP